MINIKTNEESGESEPENKETNKPDENTGILFQGFLKISDPETGEIFIQGRA